MVSLQFEEYKKLHTMCYRFISSARVQNYRDAAGLISIIVDSLQTVLCKEENDLPLLIKNMLTAQQAEDYLLVSDYIEDGLLPWIERQLTDLFEKEEFHIDTILKSNYSYNLKKLKAKDAHLYHKIQSENIPDVDERIELTKSGFFTFSCTDNKGKYYLHSNGNPYYDGIHLAAKYYNPACSTYLIYGLGLGYHCDALADMDDGARFKIYESSLENIIAALKSSNMDWLWNNDRVELVLDEDLKGFSEELKDSGRLADNTRTILMLHHPSIRCIRNNEIRSAMEELFISDSGMRNQGRLMRANFRENIKAGNYSVNEIKDHFCGKKAIIVAGGPSLDTNIELLRAKNDDYVILAVGTVFKKMMKLNIKPNFVIVTDPQRNIDSQFLGLWEETIPVLILSTAYMSIAQKYSGPKFLLLQKDYAEAESMAKETGQSLFKCGGSVVTTALDFCIHMKCSEIIFIGLDLAYTGERSHAEETALIQTINKSDYQKTKGYYWKKEGQKYELLYCEISSTPLFKIYKEWIEERIKEEDVDMPVYDATEGGAVVKGLKIERLERLLYAK